MLIFWREGAYILCAHFDTTDQVCSTSRNNTLQVRAVSAVFFAEHGERFTSTRLPVPDTRSNRTKAPSESKECIRENCAVVAFHNVRHRFGGNIMVDFLLRATLAKDPVVLECAMPFAHKLHCNPINDLKLFVRCGSLATVCAPTKQLLVTSTANVDRSLH